MKFLNKFLKLINICYNSTGIAFRNKHKRGLIVDLNHWANIGQNNYISSYNNISHDNKFIFLSQQLQLEQKTLLSIREMWNIYNWVQETRDVIGDLAEVGVFKGGSAKIICEAKGNKNLYLFDTFRGIPKTDQAIDIVVEGSFKVDSLEEVKKYLADYSNVFFYKGVFPKTAKSIGNKLFSFVHLDVDVYQSTLDGLKFFYPRISRGGGNNYPRLSLC